MDRVELNLNDLRLFVQLVDHGGISAASRRLGVPKQTLSKRLEHLEQEAGARLVQRTTRRFVVTELGRDLYRHASAMVTEAEAAEHVLAGRLAEPSGTVRVTASIPTVQLVLAPLLPTIARAYPKLRLVVDATDRFVDLVREGYDVAVRDHAEPLGDSTLVQRRLRTDATWLVAAPTFLAGRAPSRPAELAFLEAIAESASEGPWTLRSSSGEVVAVTPEWRYAANETVSLLHAARAGLGIARIPESLCAPAIASKELVRVLPEWSAGEVTTSLLVPHRRSLLPSVRVVVDALLDALAR
jgi:DNA-binding transcriptional LysR family regulator